MNFEKVEIYGFKSFADKAEIKFGDGITGIVGPNGCGKSNVADAIRWVLGEQSAKSLRGTSMQDVIFSGTQGRKSLSFCEVSLFFDNSNKMFSLDYNEVIITRKLFRSGESEYYINKQPARLKDIVDLLHECGIGKEGYTIIGQGKVEEIMSAKPVDRRLIFEEATGIAKFKTRKNESERKLERTHDNLVRYLDIISEIENQMGPLERQANKAREFNELSEELKHHELNTYIAKVDGVGDAKGKINLRIKGIDEQIDLRNTELKNAEDEYNKIFNDINKADSTLKGLNDELLEKRVSMEKSSGTRELYGQKISFLMTQIERAEKEIGKNNDLITDCNKQLKDNKESEKENSKKLENYYKKSEDLSKKLMVINEKITLGEELVSANTKKMIESIESLTDIKVNAGTMSIEKKNLSDKLEEIKGKIDELSVKRDGLFNDKEKADNEINNLDRDIYNLKNQIEEKENQVRGCNEEVAKADNEIFKINSAVATLRTKDNFYKSLKENYDGYAPSVKGLFSHAKHKNELKKRIKGVVAELIKCDKKYDIAIETALSASAQNVVTANPDDAHYLIEYLKQNRLGRITFLPITSVKRRDTNPYIESAINDKGAMGLANEIVTYDSEFENIISNLLGNTLICDNLENAKNIATKYRFAFKIVTLDGDVLSTQGAMTGGSRRTEHVGLLSSDRRIEDNEKELKEIETKLEKIKEEKGKLEIKRDKALDELNVLNDLCNGKRASLPVEREKQSIAERSLSEVGKEIESLNEIVETLKDRIKNLDEKYQQTNLGGKRIEEDKKSATEDKDKHQQEYDELKKQRDKLSEESTGLQVEITEIKGILTTIKGDNERLNNLINGAEKSNEEMTESNKNAKIMIEQLRLDQEKVALTKEEQDYINGIREKIEVIEKQKLSLRDTLNANDEKKKTLLDQLTELNEKKNDQKINLAKIDNDLEHLQQTIWEDYQETYETAVKNKDADYDLKFGESEIVRIRKKRSSLGAINATAIDDFKLLKERYDEMNMQKEDLEKAEADLREAIDKIKAEMITQFDEGFVKINENFCKIFKELFGGGRAMLQLDYSEAPDKLEAGVEIVAEPPGKKLQKISLLSGGEKALTAIAILFAILRLRPMPFCVLDEIEAALDEANVDRFARYLQKFSKETQFIVITHRKPTMELADALFGVTMQEKGVSNLVSVKLSDVAEITGDSELA